MECTIPIACNPNSDLRSTPCADKGYYWGAVSNFLVQTLARGADVRHKGYLVPASGTPFVREIEN